MTSIAFLIGLVQDPNSILFTVAFILLMISFVLELVGFLVMGTGILTILDNLIPDVQGEAGMTDHFTLNIFNWAKHKNVPISIWAATILGVFAVVGFLIQYVYFKYTGHTMNMFGASAIAIIPAILIAKVTTFTLGSTLFVDETVAVEITDFVGLPTAIVIGTASAGKPAQCKIIDKYGKPHYMMCVPKDAHAGYGPGEALVIKSINGSLAIVEEADPKN